MDPLPSGTVTFLFTDIEGSTRLWESASSGMAAALELHDSMLRSALEGHGGNVFATGGDGFAVAFSRASDAVAAAVEAQAAVAGAEWPEGARVRVRMGLHTGEVVERGGDYFGPVVNRAARLMAIAHGGQVVCSGATATLIEDQVTLLDLGEHRLRDLSSPQRVFQVGGGVFPPLRSPDVVPTNLPVARTELIGRGHEVRQLVDVLAKHRLVTLAGAGGVGKTRLALTVAADVASRFPDGCWLVELAAVTSGSGVPPAIAAAVGAPVTDLPGLARALSDRRLLVVLDNCEHLVDDVADAVEALLEAGSEPVVLATSREPLGVAGEVVHRVRSLGVPDVDADVAEALESDGVRLFVDRADAGGGFQLTEGNVGAVVEICRRLDGIPLAVELAAARATAMPVEDIARRLGERFRLLAGGSRRAQERHRTLQAAVGWSHELLSEDERVVFRRMSAFPASFDIAAAEAVVGDEGIDVVETLVSLVQRSMVVFDAGVGRYSLLETLRQYGADRLADAREVDATRERHAGYFRALANEVAPQLRDDRYATGLRRVSVEDENLRAVGAWLAERERWADLFELCGSLWHFWFMEDVAEWVDHYREATTHLEDLDARLRVEALAGLAFATYFRGDQHAEELARAAGDLAARAGVTDRGFFAAQCLGMLASGRGDPDTALREFKRALDIADAATDEFWAPVAMASTATALWELGRRDEARAQAEASLRRASRYGSGLTIRLTTMAAIAPWAYSGEEKDARSALASLRELEELGALPPRLECATDLYWGAALLTIRQSGAAGRLARAIQLADRHHIMNVIDVAARFLAIVVGRDGELRSAARLAGYAQARGSHGWMSRLHDPWVHTQLEELLEMLPTEVRTREVHTGAELTRRQFLHLVAGVESKETRRNPPGSSSMASASPSTTDSSRTLKPDEPARKDTPGATREVQRGRLEF